MNCSKHFLGFQWERHAWTRRVTDTECMSLLETDQWGRRLPLDHVVCHVQFVCRDCGKVRDGGDCGCEPTKGEGSAVCLAHVAEVRHQVSEKSA